MHTLLHSLGRIDARLSCSAHIPHQNYLNPPLPVTDEQIKQWGSYRPMQPPPLLAKLTPPESQAPPCDGGQGFLLLDRWTACFQRGYCPLHVYDEVMRLFSDGFHHQLQLMINGMRDLPYDFIIVIRASSGEVAAACMVEMRCAKEQSAVPYLFIYDLVTKHTYGRHGLAQQLIHATDALAFLLRAHHGNDEDQWRATLHGRRLFLALTVDMGQETEYWHSLVRLYNRCGMHARTEDTPRFEYYSFTPYTDHSLNPEKSHYVALYKEVRPDTVYSDGQVSLLVKNTTDDQGEKQKWMYYYTAIPSHKVDLIRRTGLTPSTHRCLQTDASSTDAMYIASEDRLTFTRQRPASGCAFVVKAVCAEERFDVRSSLPSWFAALVGNVSDMIII